MIAAPKFHLFYFFFLGSLCFVSVLGWFSLFYFYYLLLLLFVVVSSSSSHNGMIGVLFSFS